MLTGCSLLTQFDEEAQLCDLAGQCLADFYCSDAGTCLRRDGGVTGDDGGTDAGACTARETLCGDGRDNDCDGQTDCTDSDCGGVACDDGVPCTTGETCSGGTCPRGNPVICTTPPNPCQMPSGTCEASSGRCVYDPLSDGTVCGSGQAARCCAGTCINTTTNGTNCGGCGLACTSGQVCQPIDQSTCAPSEPMNTSGRCTCTVNAPCPSGQTCASNGTCRPTAATQCAPGQSVGPADAGMCGTFCRY